MNFCSSCLPSRFEERNEILLLVRAVREPLPVEVDSETGPAFDVDVPVDDFDRVVDELAGPVGIELVEGLLNEEVRDSGSELGGHG